MLGWNLPSDAEVPYKAEIALVDPFDLNRLLCLSLSIGK